MLAYPMMPTDALSIHAVLGSESWIELLFLVHACAAITLLVGYRTRLATVMCWVLLLSLHLRGPLYVMSGDRLLVLLLMWSMFLPLSTRYSLDKTAIATRGHHGFMSIASVALMGQMVTYYWVTAFAKSGELWWTGRALGFALGQASYANHAGAWLRE